MSHVYSSKCNDCAQLFGVTLAAQTTNYLVVLWSTPLTHRRRSRRRPESEHWHYWLLEGEKMRSEDRWLFLNWQLLPVLSTRGSQWLGEGADTRIGRDDGEKQPPRDSGRDGESVPRERDYGEWKRPQTTWTQCFQSIGGYIALNSTIRLTVQIKDYQLTLISIVVNTRNDERTFWSHQISHRHNVCLQPNKNKKPTIWIV